MIPPRVSVIIPVHNGSHYLAEAIESVLSQTYRAHEIIVVDDGSTDQSSSIAKRFASEVRYHLQPNRGTATARNVGTQLARGDCFAFLDQDDLWVSDKLALQVAALANDPQLDGVFGMIEQFRDAPGAAEREVLRRMNGCLPSAILVTRGAFARMGVFEAQWQIGEWADWYVRAVEAGLRFCQPPSLVARRRVHSGSKGTVYFGQRYEYVEILKASLDRRRSLAPYSSVPGASKLPDY